MIHKNDLQIRDPFVYVENEKYYLLGTTGGDCWHAGSDLMLYTSTDLEHFEKVGHMVSQKTLEGYRNIWAPELHHYNGKYYLIVSLNRDDLGRGSMILTSDTLDGEFLPLTGKYITPEHWGCLDASLFEWAGKPYLFFSNEWITPVHNDGDGAIFVTELAPDLTHIIGQPHKAVSGKHCGFASELPVGDGRTGYVAEGPYAVNENGKIALYWSTVAKDGYCVAKNVADDIFSEYVFAGMVFTKDGGHCMIFTDLDGKQQLTLHQPNDSPNERMRLFPLA